MLTWLNEKFREWDYSDYWQNMAFLVGVLCFATPAIWGTWLYWSEMLTNIPEQASFLTTTLLLLTFSFVYVLLFGVLAWVWAYASATIGVVLSTVLLPFIWIYRKICP